VPDKNLSREQFVQKVLEAYRQTPGTTGQVHRSDRLLASQQQRGVPWQAVENALVLAAARRLLRPTNAPPLTMVRSLAYFLPVIEEVLELKVSQDYFQYVHRKLRAVLLPLTLQRSGEQPRLTAWDDITHY
jgi:hypothetical protein